jgi:hypothetical protein
MCELRRSGNERVVKLQKVIPKTAEVRRRPTHGVTTEEGFDARAF